ncbi:regulator of G-protein signaling 12-like isoform X2 [Littorina saxatilis]|uniref:regulator of G-protein signaling 12-like isoform X2 n=1 Tax=Littorina saxatilis TaxID=31220 RepID=UPI0038B41DBA
MYGHHISSRRRKKRPMGHGIKNVQVSRGRSGYGFTISGQHPCVLSCIVGGSPADLAGLKAGDYLYFVNGLNVSHAPHDDVVRMVGQSTGTLDLQVAENYNSSDSSEDDYPPRSKSRYPNRVRFRQPQQSEGVGRGGIASRPLPQRPVDVRGGPSRVYRNHVPVGAESDLSTTVTSPGSSVSEERSRHEFAESMYGWKRPVYEKIGRHSASHSKLTDSSTTDMSGDGLAFSMATVQNGPVISTAKISAASKRPPSRSQGASASQSNINAPSQGRASASSVPIGAVGGGASASNAGPNPDFADRDEDEDAMQVLVGDEAKALVGYIGSIELPGNLNRPNQRLQQLRNAVRRLRVEQKIHTLVLMQVDPSGVRLSNAMGGTIAHYTVDKLAFSGICPDDKRFFGIVTLNSVSDDVSEISGHADGSPSSSCHVFMVDPDMCSHVLHSHKAKAFNLVCTPGPGAQRCMEFPHSPTHLILCIANLYRDRPRSKLDSDIIQSHAFADPSRPAQRSSSNSSNSDSGLGNGGREEQPNVQVCVVDMQVEAAASNNNINVRARNCITPNVVPSRSLGSLHPHNLSPGVHSLATPRGLQRPMSAFEVRRGLNNSSSSEEWMGQGRVDKLTPRAMPDPATGHLPRATSTDGLERNPSPENLRQSMQRLLQARQQQLQQEQAISSDSESQVSSSVHHRGNHEPFSARSAFQVPRPVSAPLRSRGRAQAETVDMGFGKLSPRALQQPGSVIRSPSAPPIPYFPHQDSDEDDDDTESEDDPFVRTIISQFNRDRVLDFGEENPRRYSEGYALSKQREKERAEVGETQKWTKTGSFRRSHNANLKANISQSHESLAVADGDNGAVHHHSSKLVGANSVNSIVATTHNTALEEEVGRVAGWAVGFPRLLADPVGRSIFTEFLKKEFSEENIVFWTAVDAYKQITDEETRGTRAREIFSTHLGVQASDPVNVDSKARQLAELYLDSPTLSMFDVAQQQIFQLMRTDSYSRFLKSDLYKGHLMREMEGHNLLHPSIVSSKSAQDAKKKGKGKENDEKRRRSLLPWRQNKKSNVKEGKGKEGKKDKEVNNNSKKGPGPGIDLSTMRKEVFNPKEPLDLEEDISTLGSKEVVIERRVLFRLDLPNHKSIGVKAKPNRSIRDVFKPILNKYGHRIDTCGVQLSGLSEFLDLDIPVSDLDNQRVIVIANAENAENNATGLVPSQQAPVPSRHRRTPLLHLPSRSRGSGGKSGSLEEITNQIFEDLMKGKSELAHTFDELGVVDLERGGAKGHKNPEEHRSLGLFGLLRKESWGAKDTTKPKNKGRVTFALPRSDSKKKKAAKLAAEEQLMAEIERTHSQQLEEEEKERRSTPTPSTNNLPGFLAADCVETVDMATHLRGFDPADQLVDGEEVVDNPLLPPPDMFDDVHYMHSGSVEDDNTHLSDLEEKVVDHSGAAPPHSQSAAPHLQTPSRQTPSRALRTFTTFGTPRSKTNDGNSARKKSASEEPKPCLAMQPVIVDSKDAKKADVIDCVSASSDLHTLGLTVSPHFEGLESFRPTSKGSVSSSASAPLVLAEESKTVGPGKAVPETSKVQLRPIPARRKMLDSVNGPLPSPRTIQPDVTISQHLGVAAPRWGHARSVPPDVVSSRGADKTNTSRASSSRVSPNSEGLAHSSKNSTPSPTFPSSATVMISTTRQDATTPRYTPPPSYSQAVSHRQVATKGSPSPTYSAGTPTLTNSPPTALPSYRRSVELGAQITRIPFFKGSFPVESAGNVTARDVYRDITRSPATPDMTAGSPGLREALSARERRSNPYSSHESSLDSVSPYRGRGAVHNNSPYGVSKTPRENAVNIEPPIPRERSNSHGSRHTAASQPDVNVAVRMPRDNNNHYGGGRETPRETTQVSGAVSVTVTTVRNNTSPYCGGKETPRNSTQMYQSSNRNSGSWDPVNKADNAIITPRNGARDLGLSTPRNSTQVYQSSNRNSGSWDQVNKAGNAIITPRNGARESGLSTPRNSQPNGFVAHPSYSSSAARGFQSPPANTNSMHGLLSPRDPANPWLQPKDVVSPRQQNHSVEGSKPSSVVVAEVHRQPYSHPHHSDVRPLTKLVDGPPYPEQTVTFV